MSIRGALRYITIIILTSQTSFFIIDLAIACAQHSMCVSTTALQENLCNVTSKVVVAQSAASVAMDVFILTIPINVVSHLRLKLERKLRLIALFSIGIMYVAISTRSFDGNSLVEVFRACGVSLGRLIVYARNVDSRDILWVAGLVTSLRYVSALGPRRSKLKKRQHLRNQYRHRMRCGDVYAGALQRREKRR